MLEIHNLIAEKTDAKSVAHIFDAKFGKFVWSFGTVVDSFSDVIERKSLTASAPLSDVHGESECKLHDLWHLSDLIKRRLVVGIVDGIRNDA